MTSTHEDFALSLQAAEAYEEQFVPALFGEWAPHVVNAAGIGLGDRVLDVACGTGVVARAAADVVGPGGTVVGVDVNAAMLAVARRKRGDVEWRQADAAALPLPDRSFDAVVCQASLMFFPDPAQALREMARVLDEDRKIAVHVWSALESQPAYGPFVEIAARHAGPEAVDLLGSYWTLGDVHALTAMVGAAGLEVVDTQTRLGTAHFDSIDVMVATEVNATPLRDRIDDKTYHTIVGDARAALAGFVTDDGAAALPIRGHVIAARKRAAAAKT